MIKELFDKSKSLTDEEELAKLREEMGIKSIAEASSMSEEEREEARKKQESMPLRESQKKLRRIEVLKEVTEKLRKRRAEKKENE